MPVPSKDRLPAELRPMVERAVASAGFDLEELDVRQAGRRQLVRIVVDSDGGVGLDDIASVSRKVAAELDERDAVLGGPYTLEVTSPGVDRPLTTPRHWRRARLRLATVRLVDETTLTGRIGDAGEGEVRLLVDGALRSVRYDQVRHAAVEIEFRTPPAAELAALGAAPDGGNDTDNGAGDGAADVSEEHR